MEKETIVFVHGAWHGKWCWEKYFVPAFSKQGYRTVTFDLPGHDKAGKIKGINKYSLGDYLRALEEEVEKLDSDPIIIGHSLGGLVIQKYLEKKACKKVVLMAPAPHYGVIKTVLRFFGKPYAYPALFGLNMFALVNSLDKSRQAFFSKELPDQELEEYTRQLCSESFLAFLHTILPGIKVNHHLKTPMLVLGARDDRIFFPKEVEDTAKKYQAEFKVFDGSGHDMMLDVRHKEVSEEIIKWLKK